MSIGAAVVHEGHTTTVAVLFQPPSALPSPMLGSEQEQPVTRLAQVADHARPF